MADVRCGDPPHGWSEVRPAAVFGLLLVRRGVVRGRVEGVEQLLDPTNVFVERLGSERQFAHPCCGVAYTEIVLSEPSMADVLGGDPVVPEGSAYTTPQVDVMHRLLLARIRSGEGDPFELAQRTVDLVGAVFGQLAPARVASGQPATVAARKQVVDDTREVLGKNPLIGLDGLSRAGGVLAPPPQPRLLRRHGYDAHPLPQTGCASPGPWTGSARARPICACWPTTSASPTRRT
ncbi:hypothetical protein [Streptomyces thioluteus]|uniref:hypothetical protein n=1 Tax=Streptomyces thioluteus TaxID=66431 RepID=UPI0031EC1B60